MRILVTGGGTGGHVFPALTTVRALQTLLAESGRTASVTWVGARGSLEERVAGEAGIDFQVVATGKLRRASNPLRMLTWTNIRDLARVPLGAAQAVGLVRRTRPDVVVGFGGYVAVPVSAATWMCRRPLVIHEQTVRLGLANRLLAPLSNAVALSSDGSLAVLPKRAQGRAEVVGNPVRLELFGGDGARAVDALGLDGFDRSLPTVYITGGAQGSVQINTLVTELLPWLLKRANVVHQCGSSGLERQQEAAKHLPVDLAPRYLVSAFVGSELPDVYALADVVISRSGAGTIAELTSLGKPAVLIPLASAAGGEQAHNARYLQEKGAARALLATPSSADLRDALEPLLTDADARSAMADSARRVGRPDAARVLAELILRVSGGKDEPQVQADAQAELPAQAEVPAQPS